jgi:transcriptional regulator PpsR
MDEKLSKRQNDGSPHRLFDLQLPVLEKLPSRAVAGLALAAADIALIVGPDDTVLDVAFHDSSFEREGVQEWVGKPLRDTVTPESTAKLNSLLSEARSGQFARKREVNHHRRGSHDLPVRYCAVPLGSDGTVLISGADLRVQSEQQQQLVHAQQAMEREYAKLRQAEARYRLLFRMAAEAVLVIDAVRETIIDANPTSVELLNRPINQIAEQKFATMFDRSNWAELSDFLATVRTGAGASEITIKLAGGQAVQLAASLFRQGGASHILVRLVPVGEGAGKKSLSHTDGCVLAAIEAVPDGFVVIDESGKVLMANAAFCDLAGHVASSQVVGHPLDRWLGRSTVDMGLIMTNIREHGSVRNFATILRDDLGQEEAVIVSASAAPDGDLSCIGFLLRRSGTPASAVAPGMTSMMRSVNQLTELVGRVPMKELVRETTDMIEKMCIEAALELTRDNKASAADLLGLSRQSFYIKMRRYGLLDTDDGSDTDS